MQKIVQRMRKEIGLPIEFTLDACRHGGMTELEEAELTDGQGRAPFPPTGPRKATQGTPSGRHRGCCPPRESGTPIG
jgi:hypothetical protein